MNIANLSLIISYLQNYHPFLSIWIISLSIVIIFAVIFRKNYSTSLNIRTQKDNVNSKENKNFFFYLQIACFSLFIILYIYLILNKAEFAYHDNGQFTFFSLQGNFFGMPIWPSAGRYWPLGLQEYNIISLFSKTPLAYHSFSIFQLLVTVYLCFSIFPQVKFIYKAIVTTIILTVPSFVISFFGLIFPERNLIFWLAIFIFCLEKMKKNKSLIYLCLVLVATQFLLYYKEPIFIFILGFSVSRLIIIAFNQQIWHHKKNIFDFIKDNWLDVGLIILSIIFIYLYTSTIQGKVETSYSSERQGINILSTLINYLKINPILLIFLIVFTIRSWGLILRKYPFDLMWDSLAIGNLLYFLVYIKINIFRWYYTAPIDFIATLYLANLSSQIIIHKHNYKYKLLGIVSLLILICFINTHYSAYAILSRKKQIDSRVQIAKFIENQINNTNKTENIELFFPEISPYDIMEFSSFLFYKKLPVLINNDKKLNNNYLIMKSPQPFLNNLCVSYRPFNCFESHQPLPKDLIIFLPDKFMLFDTDLYDYIPTTLENFQNNSVEIFHYQPEFKGLEKILYFWCHSLIDKHWLNGYIFTNFNHDKK